MWVRLPPRAPIPFKRKEFRSLRASICRVGALGGASAPPSSQLILNDVRLGSRGFHLELPPQEVTNGTGDFLMMCFQSEVASFIEAHFGAGNVAFEGFCARRQKERIVLAPDGEQRRLFRAEVFLELGIERDVARIVQKQIELNLVVARPRKKC